MYSKIVILNSVAVTLASLKSLKTTSDLKTSFCEVVDLCVSNLQFNFQNDPTVILAGNSVFVQGRKSVRESVVVTYVP